MTPLAVLAAGMVLVAGLRPSPRPTPDEFIYTVYCSMVCNLGPGHVAVLVRQYYAHAEVADTPAPTRVGHVWLGAAMMRLTGSATLESLQLLSKLAGALSLVLVCGLALGAMGPWEAAIATLFYATSPLTLAIARRGWSDGVIAVLANGMLWAVVRAAQRPDQRRWALLFFALAGYGVLVKETGVLLLILGTVALAFLAWRSAPGMKPPLRVASGGTATLLASVAVLGIACGGLSPLWTAVERATTAAPTVSYFRKYQTGSPLYYLIGLGIVDPLPFLLGLVGSLLVALRVPFVLRARAKRGATAPLAILAWFVILFMLIACAWPQKNLRFLSVIFGAVDLMAAALVVQLLAALRPRVSPGTFRALVGVTAGLLIVTALLSLRRFDDFFVRRDILDLATPWFTSLH